MTASRSTQHIFLQQIKNRLPAHLSLAEEIAEKLNISSDSAYRRIRGETDMGFDEIQKLSSHYGISLDTLLNLKSDTISFSNRSVDNKNFTYEDYQLSILENLQTIEQFDVKEMYFAAKDIPPFHYYEFPELAAFKYYFWLKIILQYPEYTDQKFDIDKVSQKLMELGVKISRAYIKVPSLEIWSNESINATLRQIEYCWESGLIDDKNLVILLCDQVQDMLMHIKKQAELGYKFPPGTNTRGVDDSFKLYYNEVIISGNTIFFNMGDTKITYITYNLFNILTTSDKHFCEQTYRYLKNIIQKSSLISTVSEKGRNKFFNNMQKKAELLKVQIR